MSPDQRGFTLLEALVALLLLAVVTLPFLDGMRAAIDAVRRMAAADRTTEAQMNAVVALRAINPAATPAGVLDLGPYRLTWQAQALGDPVEVRQPAAGARLIRFETAARVIGPNDVVWATVTVRQLGRAP